jgi:hypothetical protein
VRIGSAGPGKSGIDQPTLGVRTLERGGCGRIERRVKGENAKRAEAVVGDDLGLRIELAGRIALMKMGQGEKLGGENQDGAEERNRCCAARIDLPIIRRLETISY